MYEEYLNGHVWGEEEKNYCTGDQKEDILITELYKNVTTMHRNNSSGIQSSIACSDKIQTTELWCLKEEWVRY